MNIYAIYDEPTTESQNQILCKVCTVLTLCAEHIESVFFQFWKQRGTMFGKHFWLFLEFVCYLAKYGICGQGEIVQIATSPGINGMDVTCRGS